MLGLPGELAPALTFPGVVLTGVLLGDFRAVPLGVAVGMVLGVVFVAGLERRDDVGFLASADLVTPGLEDGLPCLAVGSLGLAVVVLETRDAPVPA